MRKRGRDECLFQYSRIASVSPHIVCFLTSQRAPGRWDHDSNTRHCTRYDECLGDAGWMSELMDIQNRSALNITPNSSRPATQTFGPSWKMWAIFLSHSGTKKGIGFFFSVPSPKGTEMWSFNKKLVCKNHRVGYKTLVWGLNRSSSISIKHYDAQNESSILLTKENGHVFGSPKLFN